MSRLLEVNHQAAQQVHSGSSLQDLIGNELRLEYVGMTAKRAEEKATDLITTQVINRVPDHLTRKS